MALPFPDLLNTDDLLSAEERDIRQTTRQLVDDLVRPHIADWFEHGELPARALAEQFGTAGLLGMHLDGYGCAGTSATAYGLACLELEAGDSGIRSLVSVQGSLAMYPIHRYGSDEQKDRWLPGMAAGELIGCFGLTEPDAGSDPAAMRTTATRTVDGWVLNGSKMWITNGTIADVAVIWARADDPADDARSIRGFVVPTDTPGFTATPIRQKLSLRASATAELSFADAHLRVDAMLPGARGLAGPLSCLTQARTGILFGALGAARDCLATALDYAAHREVFGRPLAGYQLTQAKLADLVTAWNSAYLLALHVGRATDADASTPAMVSMGKLNSTRTAIAIARECRAILGANGISGEYPVMRHAANLESVLTYEGTAEVHQLVLGRALTGLNAFGG
jgi:glutaryl-CoA dehydrogenase